MRSALRKVVTLIKKKIYFKKTKNIPVWWYVLHSLRTTYQVTKCGEMIKALFSLLLE